MKTFWTQAEAGQAAMDRFREAALQAGFRDECGVLVKEVAPENMARAVEEVEEMFDDNVCPLGHHDCETCS